MKLKEIEYRILKMLNYDGVFFILSDEQGSELSELVPYSIDTCRIRNGSKLYNSHIEYINFTDGDIEWDTWPIEESLLDPDNTEYTCYIRDEEWEKVSLKSLNNK